MTMLPFKSVAGALLFSILLGPIGLLYASFWGGVIMIVAGFLIAMSPFLSVLILFWILCSIWAVWSTNQYNKRLCQQKENNNAKNNYSAQSGTVVT